MIMILAVVYYFTVLMMLIFFFQSHLTIIVSVNQCQNHLIM